MTDAPVVEPACYPDAFASGFLPIMEVAPGIVRAVFVVHQRAPYDGSTERAVVARLVLPKALLREFAQAVLESVRADDLADETLAGIAAACGTARPQ